MTLQEFDFNYAYFWKQKLAGGSGAYSGVSAKDNR